MAMDTRALKYYYRLLPDNRALFDGLGTISGADLIKPHYPAQLPQALRQILPPLPLYQSPLQPFPFTWGRQLAQYAYYQWAQFPDRFLS